MQEPSLKNEALQNVKTISLRNFGVANADIEILSGWTYIAMFLVESKLSLELSERYNSPEPITDMERFTFLHGLYKNFVLSYAKCFSSAGKHRVALDSNNIFSTRSDLRQVHDGVINTRNTYVAHNGENTFDISLSLTLENDQDILIAPTYTVKTPVGDYAKYHELVDFCQQHVIIKINKIADKIQQRIGKNVIFKQ